MPETRQASWMRLLPREATNEYRGSPIALWALVVLCVPLTFRSLVHFLSPDAGVHSIAGIRVFGGTPEPNPVIHLFASLWGSQQVVTLAVFVVILLRYRSLIPLAWAIFLAESALRVVATGLHPLKPEVLEHTPPGARVGGAGVLLAVVMLLLSLRRRAAGSAGAGHG